MEPYRIVFTAEESAADKYNCMLDIRAKDLDAACQTCKAYLTMFGPDYHSAEIFSSWRTMWRTTGKKFINNINL